MLPIEPGDKWSRATNGAGRQMEPGDKVCGNLHVVVRVGQVRVLRVL